MAGSKNYGLYLNDDASMTFLEWRRQINSSTNSNITRIDEILGDKADHSVSLSTTLKKGAWVGANAPYTQSLSVDGLKATDNGMITIAQSATNEQLVAAKKAILFATAQTNGTLTISADGTLPDVDIPVVVVIIN